MKTLPAFCALALSFGGVLPTLAATPIGEATSVARNAQAADGSARHALERGDPVSAQETISTDKSGKAAFRFVDDTQMSVGPNSSVRLDQFVFDTDTTPSSFVIRASKGLLRFSTGHGDHDAYRIQTPTATIGVRGTQFDVRIESGQVRVSVLSGEVVLCPIRGRANFLDCVTAEAGKSILSTLTSARTVLTSTLPQIRADLLLPLTSVANVAPLLPLPRGSLPLPANGLPLPNGAPQLPDGAPDIGQAVGGAAGALGGAAGGLGGAAGGLGGAAGGLGGGLNGLAGGVGRALPRLGR